VLQVKVDRPLPKGWSEMWDVAHKRSLYINKLTQQVNRGRHHHHLLHHYHRHHHHPPLTGRSAPVVRDVMMSCDVM
jgi:nitrate reductase assembly molybdenum cofactor insertion protein NarJ